MPKRRPMRAQPRLFNLSALPIHRACLETASCVDFDSCLQLDAQVDPRCTAPCEAAVDCGAFPAIGACGPYAPDRGSPRALETYYEQLSYCMTTTGEAESCDQAVVEACFVPQFWL